MNATSTISPHLLATPREVVQMNKAKNYSYEFSDQTISEAELAGLIFSKDTLKITLFECDTLIISNCIAPLGIEIQGVVRNLIIHNVTGEIINSCISCENLIVSTEESKTESPLMIKNSKIEDLKRLELKKGTMLTYNDALHNLCSKEIIIGKHSTLTLISSTVTTEKLEMTDCSVIFFTDATKLKDEDLHKQLAIPSCKFTAEDTIISASSQLHFICKCFEFNKSVFAKQTLGESNSGSLSFISNGQTKNIRVFYKQ